MANYMGYIHITNADEIESSTETNPLIRFGDFSTFINDREQAMKLYLEAAKLVHHFSDEEEGS